MDQRTTGIVVNSDDARAQVLARQAFRIAVLVPCYNEAAAVAKVVADFRAALPEATIYVFDNNSTDDTVSVARAAGAVVRREMHQGKGFVVRRMFSDVEADIYVLVDGDATYDAPSAPKMVDLLLRDQLDMVVGHRVDQEVAAYRAGHRTGNWLLTTFVATVFGRTFNDMLSGYRVFSRRFVKSFPMLSGGFEIETELTVHALELGLAAAEVKTPYYARLEGSTSKLNTWRDGFRILWMIVQLYRSERPFPFYGAFGFILALVFGRHRDSGDRHLHRNPSGAAAADRHPGDGPDAARLPVDCGRPRARHGDARPPRDEAARLSQSSGAG